jgi:hypothetical protein
MLATDLPDIRMKIRMIADIVKRCIGLVQFGPGELIGLIRLDLGIAVDFAVPGALAGPKRNVGLGM